MKRVTATGPASVGNVAVGFDLLGHSVAGLHDTVTVTRIDDPVVRIDDITGVVTQLPRVAGDNTAGRALESMRQTLGLPYGFAISIEKGIPLGSGLGGSAASAVAAVVAANELLDDPLPREALYEHAVEGEARAAGSKHGDNVGPSLMGGLVLATHDGLVPVHVPEHISAVVVHPAQVLETRRAREVLRAPYPLSDFVAQSERLALFLLGCERGDAALLRRGLSDVLVEPRRAGLIPGFNEVKAAAFKSRAIGASISGAGPSVFAWCEGREQARRCGEAMRAAFESVGVPANIYVTPVAGPRAEVVT